MVIAHRNLWTAIGIVASDDPMLRDSVTLIRDGTGVWSEETLAGWAETIISPLCSWFTPITKISNL